MLTVRRADNQDISDTTTLINDVLQEYGLQPDPDGLDSDILDIQTNYTASGGLFVVIEDAAGRTVGTAGLWRISDKVCELRKMYFAVEIRGQGWGKAVLDFMLLKAAEMGYEDVQLETASVLVEAIGLYRQTGFRQLPSDDPAARCDRAYYLRLNEYRQPDRLRELNIEI